MKCDKKHMLLYAVTDKTWLGEETLAMQVEEALKGGATCIQLREKEITIEPFLQEAFAIKDLCKKYNIPFIINDHIDIAIKCGADGIHIGQHDMNAFLARKKIGKHMILGISVQTMEQAVLAQKCGADYLGVGAVFSTSTKLDADYVSYDTLKEICNAVSIPVVAIGGIHKHNILELSGTGVDGVALVSAIFASKHIENECKELRSLTEQMVARQPC